jgi:hypothetical protein
MTETAPTSTVRVHHTRAALRAEGRIGVRPVLSPVWPPADVEALFTAVIAEGKGDRERQAEAEAALAELAEAGGVAFEVDLVAAFAARFACMLPPDTPQEEIERAARVDVLRHVGRARQLAAVEPAGTA